jgi:uncharacterized protein (DUF1501 family)
MNHHPSDRRDFLKQLAATGGVVGVAPTLATLSSMAEAAAPGNNQITEVAGDYKAIVCVFLYGGQDHANVLIPYTDSAGGGTAEYDRYAAGRNIDNAPQSENGANLSYSRARLGEAGEARVISSANSANATTGFTTNVYGRRFALNPAYSEIAYLYKQANSKLAIISNVGPLIAPINRDAWFRIALTFQGGDPSLPANLYSHDDQQKAWMSGTPDVLNPEEGVGGRIASLMAPLNVGAQIPISVSTSGINTFMLTSSLNASPYQVGVGSVGRQDTDTGVTPPRAFCNTDTSYINANPGKNYCIEGGPITVGTPYVLRDGVFAAIRSRWTPGSGAASIYPRQWIETMDLSTRTEAAISAALVVNPLNEDTVKAFSEYRPSSNPSAAPIDVVNSPSGFNPLAAQLRMVAALIRASASLGGGSAQPMKRQVFFVAMGGFDTHGEFWQTNPGLNKRIDSALDAFWQSLGKITVRGSTQTGQDRVTLFTMTDFGRTLDSNGQGSDHGWGGHHIVLGGAVKGGYIYGANHNVAAADIPTDTFDNPQTAGQKSRFMSVDATAGAVPRYGIPPLWYEDAQGNRGPGGKCNGLNHALDRGELLPTMSSDAYVATIARWFGISSAQLATVFPKLAGAHPTFDTTNGVGFMNLTL